MTYTPETTNSLPKLSIKDSKGRVMGIFEAGKPIVMARFPDSTQKDIEVFLAFIKKIYKKIGMQEDIIEQNILKAAEFLKFEGEEDQFCS